jgi:mitogen-activated protein kinase 1/3
MVKTVDFLEADEVKKIVYELLRGLKYIHSASVLHRDIKPGNILLASGFKPKICDFGLARAGIDTTKTPVEFDKRKKNVKSNWGQVEVAGSPEEEKEKAPQQKLEFKRALTDYVVTRWYRAPEIILTKSDYGPGIDVWAVGCIFAELLSMIKGSLPPEDRQPLFPGSSCYPFSPSKKEKTKSGLSLLSSDQLNVILTVLGTPTEEDCSFIKDPEKIAVLRSQAKRAKMDLYSMFPKVDKTAIDLLGRMLVFNPYTRVKVQECLEHPYFNSIRDVKSEIESPKKLDFDFDKNEHLYESVLRKMFNKELAYYNTQREAGKIKWTIGA